MAIDPDFKGAFEIMVMQTYPRTTNQFCPIYSQTVYIMKYSLAKSGLKSLKVLYSPECKQKNKGVGCVVEQRVGHEFMKKSMF